MGRFFAGVLSFIVCVQFTVGQFPFSVSSAQGQTQTCAAGQKLDPIVGRCLSTAQASQVAQATASCASSGDQTAQRKCYLNAAEAALASAEANGDVKEAGKVSSSMMGMILTMAGLSSAVGFLLTGGPAKCGPFTTSAIIIAASSMAAFMGEILSSTTYKSKMKKANEALKKINEGSAGTTNTGASSAVMNATNVQEEAFKALIMKEDAVIAAAGVKQKLYTLAMAGYAAATVMAGIEVVKMLIPGGAAATSCIPVPVPTEEIPMRMINPFVAHQKQIRSTHDLAELYVDNYFQRNQRVPYQNYLTNMPMIASTNLTSLMAASINAQLLMNGSSQGLSIAEYGTYFEGPQKLPEIVGEDFALVKAFASLSNAVIPKAQASPLLMAGGTAAMVVLATKVTAVAAGMKFMYTNPYARLALAGVLTMNSMGARSQASKEASKAKERKTFLEKLRDQVTQDGNGVNCGSADAAQANPNCKSNTAGVITPDAPGGAGGLTNTDYSPTEGIDPILGTPKCVTNTGSFDSACSCKKNNTCLSITSSISGSIPAGVSLGSVPSTIDGITGGRLVGADLDENALNAQAARLNTLNQNLAKKNPAIAKANADAKLEANKIGKDLAARVGSAPALASAGSGSDAVLNSKSPEEALKQMSEEIKQEIGKVEGQTSPTGTPSDLDLSGLGATDETPLVVPDDKLAEVMASEYELGNNDINTESSTSIFDIVSNRYKRSGIRRLFGSESILPVDKASPNDIAR